MSFPMLPHDGKNSTSGSIGSWTEKNNANFLNQLANTLPKGADDGTIDSIPDIWAKPLLFKMALYDNGSDRIFSQELHKRVVGEWRAILAMLALQEFRELNFSLSASNINLTEDNSPLAEIFKSLIPSESFDGNINAWLTDIYVIYYQKGLHDAPKPLAFTSPLTLVTPAANYSNDLVGKLTAPWSNDGRILTDPTSFITTEERYALLSWLEKLAAAIPAHLNNLAYNLSACVTNFMDDIKAALPLPIPAAVFGTSNLNLNKGFSALLNEVVLPAASGTSPFELKVNPARTTKKIILISPDTSKNFENPAQLKVWTGVYASDITDEILSDGARNKLGNVGIGNFEFRRPEDFFHDKIAIFSNRDTFCHDVEIEGSGSIPWDFVLPVKRELLEFFSPEEIALRISFAKQGTDDILLTFKFPLHGINGEADFAFTKVYRQVSKVHSKDCGGIWINKDIPQIALWPNMRRADWHEYYLYYENFRAQDKDNANIPDDKMYYVEPWGLNNLVEANFPNHGVKNLLIERLNALPEALIFNYYVGRNAQEIGVLLLKLPQEKNPNNSIWNVGVDFGTSSTMLYFQANGGAYQPLIFKPHLLKVTKPLDFTQSDMNFIASSEPRADANGSFLSVFYSRVNNQAIRLLLEGHILNFINHGAFKILGTGVKTNLKWDADPNVVKAYIEQICLQILVEAAFNQVSQIDWNFSYPTAFSDLQTKTFRNICESSVNDAYTNTGFAPVIPPLPNNTPSPKIETWSESKASAYHFRTHNGGFKFGDGALCVDIGAGTTDITVISGAPDKIVYHTSVRYAGESMFSPIYKRYDIFTPDFAHTIQNFSGRQALIDEDMRNNSSKYIVELNTMTVDQKTADAVKKVLQCSQFAVAGLFYYLGKILKMLHSKKIFVGNTLPPVFIGGNGARIFDWLTCGATNVNNSYTDVLKKMLEVSSELEQRFTTFQRNPQPKVEVASGMLSVGAVAADFFSQDAINNALFGTTDLPYGIVLSGAEFSKNGKPHDDLDFISAQDIASGISVSNLNELEKFINAFNNFKPRSGLWGSGIRFGSNSSNTNQNAIPFSDAQISQLEMNTRNSYAQWIGANNLNVISPEPVFIVELRNLIRLL